MHVLVTATENADNAASETPATAVRATPVTAVRAPAAAVTVSIMWVTDFA